MSSDGLAFRRHDPKAWTRTLAYRDRSDLPYDASAHPAAATLMLDTTVYIDAQRASGLPPGLASRIASAPLVHSAVALGELTASLGLLDPAHPGTPGVRAAIEETLERVQPQRVVAPSADAWLEGSLVCGVLARIQGLAGADRRKFLNDALIFLSAAETDAILVSRNRSDIDLLLSFRPDIRVWLYDRPARSGRQQVTT